MRIPLQDGGQQKSVTTSYVHDGVNALKIVGLGYGRAINHGELGHRVMENLSFRWMLL
jgi:hypothetical protein